MSDHLAFEVTATNNLDEQSYYLGLVYQNSLGEWTHNESLEFNSNCPLKAAKHSLQRMLGIEKPTPLFAN